MCEILLSFMKVIIQLVILKLSAPGKRFCATLWRKCSWPSQALWCHSCSALDIRISIKLIVLQHAFDEKKCKLKYLLLFDIRATRLAFNTRFIYVNAVLKARTPARTPARS